MLHNQHPSFSQFPTNINQDQVLNSFYQQRKKRTNSTGRYHSLLQKNSSYFSNTTNKYNNDDSKNNLNMSEIVQLNENAETISNENVEKKIVKIREKIMKDMNNELANSLKHKYSLMEITPDGNDEKYNGLRKVRIQSQSTTLKNTNININKVISINSKIQKYSNIIQSNTQGKRNSRQKHLEELEKSFKDLTSGEISKSKENNRMIIEKLQSYVNKNKENMSKDESASSEMKENINIVNKIKDKPQSGIETKANFPPEYTSKHEQKEKEVQYKIEGIERRRSQHIKIIQQLKNDLSHEDEQFESPSFKMNRELSSDTLHKKKTQQSNLIKEYDYNSSLQREKRREDTEMDQPNRGYFEQTRGKKPGKIQCQHHKLIQQNQVLRRKVEELQKVNKKQLKFIQSVYRMRRTIQKTNEDCSLKDLWRWVKELPN